MTGLRVKITWRVIKAIRSGEEIRRGNRKTTVYFLSQNHSDRIQAGSRQDSALQFHGTFTERVNSLVRPLLRSIMSPESEWVIGFRRKIPEQEADGVSGGNRRRLSPSFFLRRLAFHPASHQPLTLNQSFRADKVSQPLSKVSRRLEESCDEKRAFILTNDNVAELARKLLNSHRELADAIYRSC